MSRDKEKDKESPQRGSEVSTHSAQRGNGGHSILARQRPFAMIPWANDPFNAMRRFAEEMDTLFDEGFGGRSLMAPWRHSRWHGPARGAGFDVSTWSPQVEVFQRGDRFVVRADLPGMTKDDIHVDIRDDALTIQGERRQEHEEHSEGCYHSERSYGSFFRSIPLPAGVGADKADANFRDGVLEVTMPAPKGEMTHGRRVEVKG